MGVFEKFIALLSIPKVLENLTRAIRDAAKANRGQSDLKEHISAEIRFPKAVEEAYDAAQKKQIRIQGVIAVCSFLAFVAAAIYAGIAYRQWQVAENQMRISERAWVQFRPDREQKIEVTTNSPVIFKMLAKNTGKTAARRLSGVVIVERLKIGQSPHVEDRNGTGSEVLAGVLFPDDIWPNLIIRWIRGDPTAKTTSVVNPTAEDVSDWKAGKFYLQSTDS